jgi:DNA-binding MarR family transcriptional regulator
MDVPTALRRLMASTHDLEATLANRLGVGVTDVLALQHLLDHPDVGPVDLGTALRIRSASATVLVDRLEEAGHLRRSPHPTDRRRVLLATTESASAEVVGALAPLLGAIAALVDGLTPEQRETVAGFLQDATDAIRSFAADPQSRG